MATIKDVAKLAGVGNSTVSRFINGSGYVSNESRKRIEEAIKTLEYVPNESARAFKLQDNKIIALFLPCSFNPFFSELGFYIEDELDKNGYKMMLCNSGGKIEKEISYIEMLKQKKVEGIIGISYNDIDEFIKEDMKIVSIDRHYTANIPCVSSDNFQGGVLAFQELYKNKCKKIAYVGTYCENIQTEISERRKGFVEEAKKNNMDVIIFLEPDPIRDLHSFLNQFLILYKDVDGVFVENDDIALHLYNKARDNGLSIPKDLKIIGFDGQIKHKLLSPYLTTIMQPIEQLGRVSVNILLDMINGKQVNRSTVLPVQFLKGDTTL